LTGGLEESSRVQRPALQGSMKAARAAGPN
jgi:hypothetical protein